MTSMRTSAVFVLLLALCGCKLGPNYQRPPLDVPGDYRGVAPEAGTSKTAAPSPLDTVPPQAKQPGTQPEQQQPTQPQQQPTQPAPAAPATPPEATPPPPASSPDTNQQPAAGQQPSAAGQTGQSFGDLQWAAVFQDDVLQGLIKEALANNYDIRIAATRVLQANANLGIVRANQFPTLNGSGSVINQRSQLTNLTTDKSPTYDTLAVVELHRRFLGTVPPRHRVRTSNLTG